MKQVSAPAVGNRPAYVAAEVSRVTTTRVPILYRHAESGLIEPVESEYSGPVMTRVWKNMNRQLLKLDAGSYFFPCDALDAYAEAVNKVEETAGDVRPYRHRYRLWSRVGKSRTS